MCDPVSILRLYSSVLHGHKNKYGVNEAEIRTAIQNMKEVYKPNPGSLSDAVVYVADYNDAGHRCAYLHKYAPFHTALVADMLGRALQENSTVFSEIIYGTGQINICSLGGGPGCDIFGVLSVLNAAFGLFQTSATVIDCMEKWKDMFYELVRELSYGDYGDLGECVDEQYFEWKYLQHNLLSKMTNQVHQAIAKADLVTMIKFVSASSCKDTSAMIRNIFTSMKHGALVLYIDNAGGGFHNLVSEEAENCNFESVFYQNHEYFEKPALQVRKFGYTPCFESRVSAHIWRKKLPKIMSCPSPSYSYDEQNFPPLSSITIPSPKRYGNQLYKEALTFNNKASVPSTSEESFSKFIDADHTYLSRERLYSETGTNINFASREMNVKIYGNSMGKSSKPQRKTYPNEIAPYGTARIHTNVFNNQLHRQPNASLATASNMKNVKSFQYPHGKSSDTRATINRGEVRAEASIPRGNTSEPFSWMNLVRDIVSFFFGK